MYLACDHWRRNGSLGDTNVSFNNAGGALFGVLVKSTGRWMFFFLCLLMLAGLIGGAALFQTMHRSE